jgi:hypothetical protein
MESPPTAKPTINVPVNASAVQIKVPEKVKPAPAPAKVMLPPKQANINALFNEQFQKEVGKSWAQASKVEKENFAVHKVLVIFDKLQSQLPREKKMGMNPFTQSDFTLTREEFDILPHKWFKGFYLYLKSGGYAGSLGMQLTPYERKLFIDAVGFDELGKRSGNPPTKGLFGWGGTRKARRNRRNRKTKRNN